MRRLGIHPGMRAASDPVRAEPMMRMMMMHGSKTHSVMSNGKPPSPSTSGRANASLLPGLDTLETKAMPRGPQASWPEPCSRAP
jgi:hypothetical protein